MGGNAARAKDAARAPVIKQRRSRIWGPSLLVLLLAAAAMFGDVLFTGRSVLLSSGADMVREYVPAREFGFDQLRRGNLALWNPYIYGGAPFFGNFQSALLYPPNWLFLVLPLSVAVNLNIALHVLMCGLFMAVWAGRRGLSLPASLGAGFLSMFAGPFFLHIYAGHLSNLCTMDWAPLLMMAVDGWCGRLAPPEGREESAARGGGWGWLLAGMLAVAMQVLAGHPQYAFFTAVAVGLYVFPDIAAGPHKLRSLAGVAGIYAGGAALSAVQLLTGWAAAEGSLRYGHLSREFLADSSFAPENILTAAAPTLFGPSAGVPYWGRSYLWEESAYFGATALVLMVFGFLRRRAGQTWRLAVPAGILFIFALGANTPLFGLTTRLIPGFGSFRGHGKFIFLASVFAVLAAAMGADDLIGRRAPRRKAGISVVCAGAVFLVLAGAGFREARASGGGAWRAAVAAEASTGETWQPPGAADDHSFVRAAGTNASSGLLVAGLVFCFSGGLVWLSGRNRNGAYLLLGLAAVEVFVAGRMLRPTYDPRQFVLPERMERFYATAASDVRVLDTVAPNRGMSTEVRNIWGSGPEVRRRFAEFAAAAQDVAPEEATQMLAFQSWKHTPMLRLMRLSAAFVRDPRGIFEARFAAPLPVACLVPGWRIVADKDERLEAMKAPDFDPGKIVFLETEPGPAALRGTAVPSGGANPENGRVELVDSSTDHLTFQAETSSPAILLVTEAYDEGWVVEALPGSDQKTYVLQPADHCFRGVYLRAGRHRLVMRYAPPAFRAGACISALAAVLFTAAAVLIFARRVRGG